jgi:hypothetical protein
MTTHKPSADHPWKRDRYKNGQRISNIGRTPPTFRSEHDKAVLTEIRTAVLIDKMPLLPSALSETQFSDRDMVVLSGEGCRQKRAMRYG